jgi:hypothetical protein
MCDLTVLSDSELDTVAGGGFGFVSIRLHDVAVALNHQEQLVSQNNVVLGGLVYQKNYASVSQSATITQTT